MIWSSEEEARKDTNWPQENRATNTRFNHLRKTVQLTLALITDSLFTLPPPTLCSSAEV